MSRPGEEALLSLAAQLGSEDTPIAERLEEPAERPRLGEAAAAAGGREAAEYALLVESIREGYLLHYGGPRLLAGPDEDLALLAGDYLYALGLARLARLGDERSVLVLADLISRCAQLHAEGRGGEAEPLWEEAVAEVARAAASRLG